MTVFPPRVKFCRANFPHFKWNHFSPGNLESSRATFHRILDTLGMIPGRPVLSGSPRVSWRRACNLHDNTITVRTVAHDGLWIISVIGAFPVCFRRPRVSARGNPKRVIRVSRVCRQRAWKRDSNDFIVHHGIKRGRDIKDGRSHRRRWYIPILTPPPTLSRSGYYDPYNKPAPFGSGSRASSGEKPVCMNATRSCECTRTRGLIMRTSNEIRPISRLDNTVVDCDVVFARLTRFRHARFVNWFSAERGLLHGRRIFPMRFLSLTLISFSLMIFLMRLFWIEKVTCFRVHSSNYASWQIEICNIFFFYKTARILMRESWSVSFLNSLSENLEIFTPFLCIILFFTLKNMSIIFIEFYWSIFTGYKYARTRKRKFNSIHYTCFINAMKKIVKFPLPIASRHDNYKSPSG